MSESSARQLAYAVARLLRSVATRMDPPGARPVSSSRQSTWVRRVMDSHDMVEHPDEAYYAEQYFGWIIPQCERDFPNHNVRVLDIGCGQGRLAVPLARWADRGTVVGIDIVPSAIEKARTYAGRLGVTNVEFHESDALAFLRGQPASSFSAILMIETTFFIPAYREVLAEAMRVLAPGARLWLAVWSQFGRLLDSVRRRDWDAADMAWESREGHLGGGPLAFSWHTAAETAALLHSLGLSDVHCRGIGVCSGIEGDALATIAQPSRLMEDERRRLMALERRMSERYADAGRYILGTGRKPTEGQNR